MKTFIALLAVVFLSGCYLEASKPLLSDAGTYPFDGDTAFASPDRSGQPNVNAKGKMTFGIVEKGWREHSVAMFPNMQQLKISFHPLQGSNRFVIQMQKAPNKPEVQYYLGELEGDRLLVWTYDPKGDFKKEVQRYFPTLKPKGSATLVTSARDVFGIFQRVSAEIDAKKYKVTPAPFVLGQGEKSARAILTTAFERQCLALAGHGTLPAQDVLPEPLKHGIGLSAINTKNGLTACNEAVRLAPTAATQLALARVHFAAKNYDAARETLDAMPAADQGIAMMTRGGMYYEGKGMPRDMARFDREARGLIAKYKDPHAAYTLSYYMGFGLIPEKKAGEALQFAQFALRNGIPEADVVVGYIHRNGIGVPKNQQSAFAAFRRASAAGDLSATRELGAAYYFGEGTAKNDKLAFSSSKAAADRGDVFAQYLTGFMYSRGQGVKEDNPKGVKYFKLAHKQNHAASTGELGWMTYRGDGIKENRTQGLALLEKAAAANDANAKKYLDSVRKGTVTAAPKKNGNSTTGQSGTTSKAPRDMVSSAPKKFQADLMRLAQGQKIRFSGVNTPFMGGLTTGVLERCSTPKGASRIRLAGFVTTATNGAIMGGDYSNPNIGESIKNMMAQQSVFAAGAVFGRQLPCGPVSDKFMEGVLKSVTATLDGPFVGSCTPVHGKNSCNCLARTARHVMPDISQRRYSPRVIKEIIERNPFLGLQIGLTCGISNY